jgi:hypothetical protein
MKEFIQPIIMIGLGGYLLADIVLLSPAAEEATLDRQAVLTDKIRDLEKQLASAKKEGYVRTTPAPREKAVSKPTADPVEVEEAEEGSNPYEEERIAEADRDEHRRQIDLALELLSVDYKAKIEVVQATISRGNEALTKARFTPAPYETSSSRIRPSQADRDQQEAEKQARIEQIKAALEQYHQQERDLRSELARKQAELRAQR